MGKLQKFILPALQCRDLWQEEDPETKPRTRLFSAFVTWVMQRTAVGGISDVPDCIRKLLAAALSPNNVDGVDQEEIENRLRIRTHQQYFRVVQGSDITENSDKRVRTVIEITLRNEDYYNFPHAALICPFFTAVEASPRTRALKKSCFTTTVSTSFQRVLFIGMVQSLQSLRIGRGQSPRVSTSSSDVHSDPVSTKKRKHDPEAPKSPAESLHGSRTQRTGFAVQCIVIAWDQFAKSVGLTSAEHLVLPYVRMARSTLTYIVLPSRSDGFAPHTQALDIAFDVAATHIPDQTFADVVERSEVCDARLRFLAQMFLDDIRKATHNSYLYKCSDVMFCEILLPFRTSITEHALPSRFQQDEMLEAGGVLRDAFTVVQRPFPFCADQPQAQAQPKQTAKTNEDRREQGEEKREIRSTSTSDSENRDRTKRTDHGAGLPADVVETFSREIRFFSRVYNCSYEDVLEIDESLVDDGGIEGQVQLLLTDPPYNTRRRKQKSNSAHDLLTTEDMSKLVSLASQLLRCGGHGLIFCTAQQFKDWYKLFSGFRNDDGRKVFSVDAAPLTLIRDSTCNTGYPGRSSCTLQCSIEMVLHLKKNGLSYAEEYKLVNYDCFNYVPSSFPAYRNVIDNIKGPVPGEQLRLPHPTGGKSSALRPEQKPIALMKELISRFSTPGALVVDLFGGTLSTAHACVELPRHRRFVGCEVDEECYEIARRALLCKVAHCLTSRSTDIGIQESARETARLITSIVGATSHANVTRWRAPEGLPQYQRFPRHIVVHLASISSDPHMLRTCMETRLDAWPRTLQSRLEEASLDTLLALDSSAFGLIISKSSIRHKTVGRGAFAARRYESGEIIAPIYGTLVYHDMCKRSEVQKTYAFGMLGVTPDRFKRYAIFVRKQNRNAFHDVGQFEYRSTYDFKSIFVVPAPFCAAGFVNDARYTETDEEYEAFRRQELGHPRSPNCRIQCTRTFVSAPPMLEPYNLFVLEATTVIECGEELFTCYEDDYRLSSFETLETDRVVR